MDKYSNKLWVLSEVYYPEEAATAYIMTEIVNAIADSREVNVICGPISYENKSNKTSFKEFNKNITLYRINLFSFNKNKLVARTIRMILLTLSMSFKLLLKSKKGDEVLIVTNPAFLLLLTGYIANLKKLKLSILVHDVFPENIVAAGILNRKNSLLRLLKSFFDKAYSRADMLIVLGRDMKQVICTKTLKYAKKNKIEIIENWADIINIKPSDKSLNKIVESRNLSKKIIFQYAGNIGRLQGLQSLFSIIKEVDNPLLHFIFMGEGALKEDLQKYVADNQIGNIEFGASMARSAQNEFLNACDVSLVCLTDNMLGLGVPSKSYNIMAAGKPILFIGDKKSEIALTIKENDNGWVFENHEKDNLVKYFNSIDEAFLTTCKTKGKISRSIAEIRYSKEYILDKFKGLLG